VSAINQDWLNGVQGCLDRQIDAADQAEKDWQSMNESTAESKQFDHEIRRRVFNRVPQSDGTMAPVALDSRDCELCGEPAVWLCSYGVEKLTQRMEQHFCELHGREFAKTSRIEVHRRSRSSKPIIGEKS